MKYGKKPVVIDAIQFTREMAEGSEALPEGVRFIRRHLSGNGKFPDYCNEPPLSNFESCHTHVIETLEGQMLVDIGDWVIKGVKGDFYPCKPDIFEQTYEKVEV